jgi:hypothetical protein
VKRGPLATIEDICISREEVETIVLYLQSWVHRQCSCSFREQKNFERFNWALQTLILIVVEVIKRLGNQKVPEKAEALTEFISGKGKINLNDD